MELEIQGNLLKVKGLNVVQTVCSKRGKVTAFTSKSRKRLLEIIARMAAIKQALFLTLTYGQEFPDEREAKKHLKAFIRIIRKKYPKVGIIWRMEYQKRGAPHFHLIIFGVRYIPKKNIAARWAQCIGSQYLDYSKNEPRAPFTRIEQIRNNRHAMAYVSKYVAKVEKTGFNNLPYRNRDIKTGKFTTLSPGRFWGITGKQFIILAAKVTWKIQNVATLDALCSAAKKQWCKMRFRRHGQGFTLFIDSPLAWLQLLIESEKLFDDNTISVVQLALTM